MSRSAPASAAAKPLSFGSCRMSNRTFLPAFQFQKSSYLITTLNGVDGLRSPESISWDNKRDCIGTQLLPLLSSSGNWAFSQFGPREISDAYRHMEFLRHRASCVSTQREANEISSGMVRRSSFFLTCARWASTVLVLKWSSSAIWTVLLPRPIS